MTTCIFCMMRLKNTPHLKEPLQVVLTSDSMSHPYFMVVVPTCQAHESIPGVLDRVMAGLEEKICYDEGVKLFEKEEVPNES